MADEKVRIINEKTGHVRWVMPHVAEQTKMLYSYGYFVQDLPKEKVAEVKPVTETKPEALSPVEGVLEVKETELDLLAESVTEEKPKGKPGKKPAKK